MVHRTRRARLGLLLALAALPLGLGACQTPPPGNTGGRVDPYRSTPADEYSPEANTVTLLEFADQVSEAIVQRIGQVPEIRTSPQKVVVELGALTNNTRTPTSDFAIVRRRVLGNLVNATGASAYADFYEAPELMDPQHARLAPPGTVSPSGTPTDRYPTREVYVLQGDFGEMVRGRQSTYLFEMTLTNLQSRRIVFNEQVISKQGR